MVQDTADLLSQLLFSQVRVIDFHGDRNDAATIFPGLLKSLDDAFAAKLILKPLCLSLLVHALRKNDILGDKVNTVAKAEPVQVAAQCVSYVLTLTSILVSQRLLW